MKMGKHLCLFKRKLFCYPSKVRPDGFLFRGYLGRTFISLLYYNSIMSSVEEDMLWVTENYLSLQEAYPGQFIVVKNGKVVAVARSFDVAEDQARKVLSREIPFVVHRIEAGDLFAQISIIPL